VGRVSYELAGELAPSKTKEALPGEVPRSEGRTRIQQRTFVLYPHAKTWYITLPLKITRISDLGPIHQSSVEVPVQVR